MEQRATAFALKTQLRRAPLLPASGVHAQEDAAFAGAGDLWRAIDEP